MEKKFEILANIEEIILALQDGNMTEKEECIKDILKLEPTERDIIDALSLLKHNYSDEIVHEYNKEYIEVIKILKEIIFPNIQEMQLIKPYLNEEI
jgi:hypothetical protein